MKVFRKGKANEKGGAQFMAVRPNESDPRVIRTRKLILEAFASLLNEKDFEAITVQDIAQRATVNRATFYAHFADKYALIEVGLVDTFMTLAAVRIDFSAELTREMLQQLILSVCDFQEALITRCRRNYQSLVPVIESKIKQQLQLIITDSLVKQGAMTEAGRQTTDLAITMTSWAIYGAVYHWSVQGRLTSAERLAETILPFITAGMETVMEEEGFLG